MNKENCHQLLSKIQAETFQTKILNIILTLNNQIEDLKIALIDTQQKMNEIIETVNQKEEKIDAEALNPDISEDSPQVDIIDN